MSKDNRIYLYLSLGVGLMIFLFLFESEGIFLSSMLGLSISSIMYLWLIIDEFISARKHYTIIESNGFRNLLEKGFKIQKVNNYIGITGIHKNYIFDIYYDHQTYIKYKSYEGVIFNIYFSPPTLENGETDYIKLNKLAEKYFESYWSFKNYQFWWREGHLVMKNTVRFFNPSYDKLVKRMNIAVNILIKEAINPLDQESLDNLRSEFPETKVPEILHYFKYDIESNE